MEFKDFNLHPDLQRGIADADYISCMPVQEQVLTHAFGGQDLYVQSQTGTGKTAAFLVLIYQRMLAENLLAGKKALIMAPTRELAVQIEEEAKKLAKYLPLKVGSFYGGVGYAQQEKLLRDNVQIMTGTPGRVLDLNKSGKMNLMDIAFLVIDEADRMFDMGFYPDLRKLIKVVPSADRRQTMLFSATLNAWVKNLAWEYTKSPVEIEIKPEVVTVEEIDQILYHVTAEEKMKLLLGILQKEQPDNAVIFCNTKRYTEIVAKRLRINGYNCEFIIGDLPQVKRLKVIDDVKAGKTKLLVATDVAARGLDIEGLSMVVNYDVPTEAENYVHRIGRTARAGKSGKAVTLSSEQDVYELPAIERYIGKKIPSEVAPAEYYVQDASEGQYIRTDIYDDRSSSRLSHGSPRSGRGGKTSPRGRDRGGRDRKDSKRRDERASAPRGGSQSRGENRGERKGKDRRQEAQSPMQASQENLYRLNSEERMALYKKKYHSEKAETSGGGGISDGKGRRKQRLQQTGKSAEARRKTHSEGRLPSERRLPSEKRPHSGKPPSGKPVEPSRKNETAPVKKGFFSRLLGGLFGKK